MTASRILIESLGTTDALAELFSDRSMVRAMLDVEVALGYAAARSGAIPARAAEAIAAAARAETIDVTALVRGARESGTPVPALVRALTAQVGAVDADSARYVHWGATSQDVSDTALSLLLARSRQEIARDHAALASALRTLSDEHATTLMLGRTLMQPAVPITFGLKVAGWWQAIDRAWRRLDQAWGESLAVQLGGAAGTRAALGAHGADIASALAAELSLEASAPWHTNRDRLGGLVAACGLYTMALGKAARDVTLLMQAEVGEVAEPGGGSSSMPHKRNPAGSAIVLAAATRLPGLVAAFLSGMVQEHERSVGGGHAEWPTIAAAVQATGAATAALATTIASLTVDASRMRHNLDATLGVVYAERAVVQLAPRLGREEAVRLVTLAVAEARDRRRSFAATLRGLPEVSSMLGDLEDLDQADTYLGDADTLRRELLGGLVRSTA